MSRRAPRSRYAQKPNSPPQGEPWIWYSIEMLESPAWAAMTLNARRILDRLCIENRAHAGTANGSLCVTYDEFMTFGIPSRNAVAAALRVAVALGFVDVTFRGRRSYGGSRLASCYALTWLDQAGAGQRTNRWKRIATKQEADKVVARAIRSTERPTPSTQGRREAA